MTFILYCYSIEQIFLKQSFWRIQKAGGELMKQIYQKNYQVKRRIYITLRHVRAEDRSLEPGALYIQISWVWAMDGTFLI